LVELFYTINSGEPAEKLAPIVRGWRNYHPYCKMDGSRFSLYFMEYRAWKIFNKESKLNRYQVNASINMAFPSILTQKTNTSRSKGIEAYLMEISSTGAREILTNMTELQPEHSSDKTMLVADVVYSSETMNEFIYITLMVIITIGNLKI